MDNNRPYWWSGPICGLGNRLIALAAVKACTGDRVVHFPWSIDPSCPGAYDDILKPMLSLRPRHEPVPGSIILDTHGWEPLTIHQQLNTALDLKLSVPQFCQRLVRELRNLPFQDELNTIARDWRAKAGEASLVGVHIRRTDRTQHHRDQFRAFLMRKQGMNRELPLHLNILYGLCPTQMAYTYENLAIARTLRQHRNNQSNFRYAVFSDTDAVSEELAKTATRFGVTKDQRLDHRNRVNNSVTGNDEAIRQTTIKDAVVDLLCLAQCDAIAQSNRASTFSLVAALIGDKPVITGNPRYLFWIAVEKAGARQT